MNAYKFDLKEVIHGSIEIDAEYGVEAEEKFMEMSLKAPKDGSIGSYFTAIIKEKIFMKGPSMKSNKLLIR